MGLISKRKKLVGKYFIDCWDQALVICKIIEIKNKLVYNTTEFSSFSLGTKTQKSCFAFRSIRDKYGQIISEDLIDNLVEYFKLLS